MVISDTAEEHIAAMSAWLQCSLFCFKIIEPQSLPVLPVDPCSVQSDLRSVSASLEGKTAGPYAHVAKARKGRSPAPLS